MKRSNIIISITCSFVIVFIAFNLNHLYLSMGRYWKARVLERRFPPINSSHLYSTRPSYSTTPSSYECRATQLLSLLWTGSVSMTECGNSDLRPWLPVTAGFYDLGNKWLTLLWQISAVCSRNPGWHQKRAGLKNQAHFLGQAHIEWAWFMRQPSLRSNFFVS